MLSALDSNSQGQPLLSLTLKPANRTFHVQSGPCSSLLVRLTYHTSSASYNVLTIRPLDSDALPRPPQSSNKQPQKHSHRPAPQDGFKIREELEDVDDVFSHPGALILQATPGICLTTGTPSSRLPNAYVLRATFLNSVSSTTKSLAARCSHPFRLMPTSWLRI